MNTRVIPFENVFNCRDLGGYTSACGRVTRWRHVFRSGQVQVSSDTDGALLEELNIRVVVDLRSASERLETPHALVGRPNTRYRYHDHRSVEGNLRRLLDQPGRSSEDSSAAMIAQYREFPYEYAESYRLLFAELVSGPLPLLFNCAAGKDRTGVAAALLLLALEVAWDDIVADYMITNDFSARIMQLAYTSRWAAPLRTVDPVVAKPLFAADPAYLLAMRESIDERSGSVQGYLEKVLRLDAAAVIALKNRLLE